MTLLTSFKKRAERSSATSSTRSSTTSSTRDESKSKRGRDDKSTVASSTCSKDLLSGEEASGSIGFRGSLERSSAHRISFALAPSTNNEARTRRATMEMTINKLQFNSLGLIGRSEEVDELINAVKRSAQTKSKELILIAGESGTGKTALAKSVDTEKTKDCMFLSSKFDLMFRDKEPYAGIAGACRELCREMLLIKERDQERFDLLCQGLQEAVGPDDLSLLANIISGLDELFDITPEQQNMLAQQSMQERMHQTIHAFRRFFRKLSVLFPSVLLIMLDDCQWADFASLNLLETLLTDDKIEGLVVIGCYRSDEVSDAHIFSQMIRNLQAKVDESFFMSTIQVGNLNVHQVQELLMELLSEGESSSIKAFAELCHRKTLGNAFFLQQFLSHLDNASLLKFNFGLLKWTWDQEEIAAQTMSTENILDLLKGKMATMAQDVNDLLAIMACLGSEVPESVLFLVWYAYGEAGKPENSVEEAECALADLLNSAIEEGFLELHPTLPIYQFVHDKVHECCLEAVDPLVLPQMKTRIGNIVVAELKKGTIADHFLFVAAGLLNQGVPPEEVGDKVALAQLNLQAAQNAVDSSSFTNASQYIKHGVKLLPRETKWSNEYYSLTLNLYSLGAEVESCMARFKVMKVYCDEVLEQTERPLSDKFRVYNVLQDSLLNQDKHDEAGKMGFDVCKQLGFRFPKRWLPIQISILIQVVGTVMKVKQRTVEEVQSLPILTDPTIHQAMHILDKTTTCCYMAKDERLPLAIMRSFNLSLKHGLSEYSPPAYATVGLILTSLGDFVGAAQMVDCCMAIMEKVDCRKTAARVTFVLNITVLPWFRPYQGRRKELLESYNTGLLVGDVESAMWSIANYVAIGFQIGKHLASLVADLKIYVKQIHDMQQLQVHKYAGILQAVILELSGEADTDIGRDAKSFDFYSELITELQFQTLDMHRSRLCAIMGYHAEGAQLSIDRGDVYAKKDAMGLFWNISDAFYRAVSLFAMARQTKRRRFLRLAKKQHSLIKGWAKNGCPNVSHYEYILDAETDALKSGGGNAEELYQKGIAMASRSGFIMDAALASERCSDFLLRKMEDRDGAVYRMKEALRYYDEWGAQRKVEQLENEHADLLPGPAGGIVMFDIDMDLTG